MIKLIPLKYWVMIGILIVFITLSYLYIKELKHSVSIEEQLSSSQTQVAALQLNYAIKEQSCLIDDLSIAQVETEKKELEDEIGSLEEELTKLSKQGPLIKKPNTISTNTEAPKNAEQSNVLVGTELLGDDLVKLLFDSYCTAEPTDSYCATR